MNQTKLESVKELFYGLNFIQYVCLAAIFVAGVVVGCAL